MQHGCMGRPPAPARRGGGTASQVITIALCWSYLSCQYVWVTIGGGSSWLLVQWRKGCQEAWDEMKVGHLQLVLWAWQVAVGMV